MIKQKHAARRASSRWLLPWSLLVVVLLGAVPGLVAWLAARPAGLLTFAYLLLRAFSGHVTFLTAVGAPIVSLSLVPTSSTLTSPLVLPNSLISSLSLALVSLILSFPR